MCNIFIYGIRRGVIPQMTGANVKVASVEFEMRLAGTINDLFSHITRDSTIEWNDEEIFLEIYLNNIICQS